MSEQADRNELIDFVSGALQVSAKSRSRDGMTGIAESRANGLALDVVDRLLQEQPERLLRLLDGLSS